MVGIVSLGIPSSALFSWNFESELLPRTRCTLFSRNLVAFSATKKMNRHCHFDTRLRIFMD